MTRSDTSRSSKEPPNQNLIMESKVVLLHLEKQKVRVLLRLDFYKSEFYIRLVAVNQPVQSDGVCHEGR